MLALNHALFGSIIAVTLKQPALVVPAAAASHFALDVLPHFGNSESFGRHSKSYYRVIKADGIATIATGLCLIVLWPQMGKIIFLGGFSAIAPDLLWPLAAKTKPDSLLGKYFRLHKAIQLSETRKGIIFEIAWLGVFLSALVSIYFSTAR
jgi:hypothetical protein